MPACKANQIINPATGRCVLKNGLIGKQILGYSPPKTKKEPKVSKVEKVKSPPKPKVKKVKSPPKPKVEKIKSPSKLNKNKKNKSEETFETPSGFVDDNTKKVAEITKYLLLNPVNKTQAYIKRKAFIELMQNKYGYFFQDIETLAKIDNFFKIKELYNLDPSRYENRTIAHAIINLMFETRNFYDNLLFNGYLKKTEDITTFSYDEKDKVYKGVGIMAFAYYHQIAFHNNNNPHQEYILGDMKIINDTYLFLSQEIKNLETKFKNKAILNDTLEIFGSFISIVILIMEHEIAHQLNLQLNTYNNLKIDGSGGGHTRQFWKIYSSYTGHDVHLNFTIFYGLLNNNTKSHYLNFIKSKDIYISEEYAEDFVNKALEKLLEARND